ncbi:MAG: hypothetical protein ACLP9L_18195 [Thermoguttaceae bacterium]
MTTLIRRVICLAAEIASADTARHDARVQWPAAVVIDGVRYRADD